MGWSNLEILTVTKEKEKKRNTCYCTRKRVQWALQTTAVAELWQVASHGDVSFNSFLGNHLGRLYFSVLHVMKRSCHSYRYFQFLTLSFFSLFCLFPMRLPTPKKKKALAHEKWNWANTSKLCSQESTAMHTKPQEVHERENETERGGTSVASHTRLATLTFGLAQCFFSRKLFFQPQVTEMSF